LADEDDFIGSDYCRARGFNVLWLYHQVFCLK
jgi:hypothetical protein